MKRVLIVDDQSDIRELIRMTLEMEGVDIHEANDGDECMALAKSIHPDLILLDVMMPGSMDGFEVCRRIKANDSLKRAKIVMLTARSHENDQQEGARSGANGYLTKPFSPRQLLSVVAGYLS